MQLSFERTGVYHRLPDLSQSVQIHWLPYRFQKCRYLPSRETANRPNCFPEDPEFAVALPRTSGCTWPDSYQPVHRVVDLLNQSFAEPPWLPEWPADRLQQLLWHPEPPQKQRRPVHRHLQQSQRPLECPQPPQQPPLRIHCDPPPDPPRQHRQSDHDPCLFLNPVLPDF